MDHAQCGLQHPVEATLGVGFVNFWPFHVAWRRAAVRGGGGGVEPPRNTFTVWGQHCVCIPISRPKETPTEA